VVVALQSMLSLPENIQVCESNLTKTMFMPYCSLVMNLLCKDLSDNASREYSLEKQLDVMQSEWSNVKFELSPWKNTGVEKCGKGGGRQCVQAF
jgi:hypothetical protein